MENINGTSLSNLCDYSLVDHMGAVSIPKPQGGIPVKIFPSFVINHPLLFVINPPS